MFLSFLQKIVICFKNMFLLPLRVAIFDTTCKHDTIFCGSLFSVNGFMSKWIHFDMINKFFNYVSHA
jgi:hypothetical protein